MQTYFQEEFYILRKPNLSNDKESYGDLFSIILKRWLRLQKQLSHGIGALINASDFFHDCNFLAPNEDAIIYEVTKTVSLLYFSFNTLAIDLRKKNLLSIYYHCERVKDEIRNEFGYLIDWWVSIPSSCEDYL